jgi:hypothetical protein
MQGGVDEEAEEEANVAMSPEFIHGHSGEVQLGKMPRD